LKQKKTLDFSRWDYYGTDYKAKFNAQQGGVLEREIRLAKVQVAGSNPVSRSNLYERRQVPRGLQSHAVFFCSKFDRGTTLGL